MTTEELRALPKIELHCHLDGSLSREFMEKQLKRSVLQEEISVGKDCDSLTAYLEKFTLPGQCLREKEALTEAGYDVLSTMAKENVCYSEIRFAPLLSVTEKMNVTAVLEALLKGLAKGEEDFGIKSAVIVCAMRQHSFEESLSMLKAAREFLGAGVCGADLAGAELAYPMTEFLELFHEVKQLAMPFTIHAGECGNAQNIADAVRAGAARIGHGIAMRGNLSLQQVVKKAGVSVELCPSSNLQTKAVLPNESYPLREFLEAGILVTINTDNRTVSHTSLTNELALLKNTYGITDQELFHILRHSPMAAFASREEKERLTKQMDKALQEVKKGGHL